MQNKLQQSNKVDTDIKSFEMISLLNQFYTDLVLWYKRLLVSEKSPTNNKAVCRQNAQPKLYDTTM